MDRFGEGLGYGNKFECYIRKHVIFIIRYDNYLLIK